MPRLKIRKGEAPIRDQTLAAACVVGRDPSADFVVDDYRISRRHFKVYPHGEAWVIEDLASTNGTLVNGVGCRRQTLADGDIIAVGTTQIVFLEKEQRGDPSGAPVPSRYRTEAPRPRRRRRR